MENHNAVDERPPRGTLFLHEDILARTLAYERDLQNWRISELAAGRRDPGRPAYNEVSVFLCSFGVMPHQYFRYLVHKAHNTAGMPHTTLNLLPGMRV